MKRRSFLGLIGGAAAAGPSLAGSIATAVEPTPIRGGAVLAKSARIGPPDVDYATRRIQELRRLIAGEEDEEQKEARRIERMYALDQAERFQLDSLRSIAPQHKSRMLIRRQERVEKTRDYAWWKRELSKLLRSE